MRKPSNPRQSVAEESELDALRARVAWLEQRVSDTQQLPPEMGEALRQVNEQLTAIVAASPLPIVVLTRDGDITLWNPAAERVFGWTSAEVMGGPLPFIPEEKSAEHRAMRQSDLAGAFFTNREICRRRKDGTRIDLSVSTAPLHNTAGQIVGIMSIYVDVTERRLTEEAFRVSEERLDLATRAHGIGIFDWDIQHGQTVWTELEEAIFGLAPGTFEGSIEGWAKRVFPDDLARVRAQFEQCWANQQPETFFEFRIRRPDGAVRHVEGSGRFVYGPDGTPLRMVGVNIDVTARKAMEADLQSREEDLRALLAALPDVIARFNQDLRFTYVNSAAEHLSGIPTEFFIGKTHTEIGMAEDLSRRIRASLQNVLDSGQTNTIEFDYPSVNSGIRHLMGIAVPERAQDGSIVAVLSILRDITEQKRSELALRASEERLRLAADAGRVGLWDWDVQNDRVTWSDRVYDMHGITPAEFGGRAADVIAVVHPDDQDLVQANIKKALSTKTEFAFEFRTLRPDGTLRWIATRAEVIFEDTGKPIRMFGASIDITERREAAESLRRANNELEEFAYAASHDLREPLRTINNYTELLLRQITPTPQIGKYTDFIRGGVRRMEMLIDGLLAFSKVVHGDTEVQRVELDAVLDDAVEVFADSLREAEASVSREPLPAVRGDALQLGQLWQNLLSNAIKYRRHDVPLDIRITTVEQGQAWVISVSDNGVGFRPEYAERIFGLFKRLHGREIPGTGVGLGICRRIVERYGGTISAFSEGEGQGATFSFTLPRYT